jgi:hypothetical protein
MNKMASQGLWQHLCCSGLSFPALYGGNGQLEGLRSFLVPLNNSGLSWFNGKFASIPHRAANLSPEYTKDSDSNTSYLWYLSGEYSYCSSR